MTLSLRQSATLLALGTALISGFSNFVAKISVTVVKDPLIFTTLKNGLVALALLGILVLVYRRGELRVLTKAQWLRLLAIGLIGGAVPFGLFFTGLAQTSAVNASLIHKSLFLWVALLAFPFLKERLTRGQWIGVGLVAVANLFVGGFTGFRYNAGELMIFGATLLWAVENVIAKRALADLSSLTVAGARMVIGSLLLVGFLMMRGTNFALDLLSAEQWRWTLLSSLLLLGYVTTWYAALKRAPATYVATLLVPATLVTNILSAIFLTHQLPLVQIINAVVLSAGAFCLIRFSKRRSEAASVTVHAEG